MEWVLRIVRKINWCKHRWYNSSDKRYLYSANRLVGFSFLSWKPQYDYFDRFKVYEYCLKCEKHRIIKIWRKKFPNKEVIRYETRRKKRIG